MTIPYDAHRAVEFALGVVVGGLPLLLVASSTMTISAAAVVFCGFAGTMLTLQGIGGTRDGQLFNPREHASVDRTLVAMLLIAAIVLGVAGEGFVSLLCTSASIVLAASLAFTRFSTLPSDQEPTGTVTSR
jgi:uncharacterized membrane protein YoaK (UPF0700 family)